MIETDGKLKHPDPVKHSDDERSKMPQHPDNPPKPPDPNEPLVDDL